MSLISRSSRRTSCWMIVEQPAARLVRARRAAGSRRRCAARSAGSSVHARRRRRSSRSPRCGCRAPASCRAARRERWPISSERSVKSGISWRDLMPRRTRSAASARRRIGSAMVPASKTATARSSRRPPPGRRCKMAQRSEAMTASMSPPCVESSSAPRTARKRWIGTRDRDDGLAARVDAHDGCRLRRQRALDLRIGLAVAGADVLIGRRRRAVPNQLRSIGPDALAAASRPRRLADGGRSRRRMSPRA